MAKEIGAMVKVCAVDCTLNFKACQGIKGKGIICSSLGFPTIKYYPSSGLNKTKKELGKCNFVFMSLFLEYQGERKTKAMIEFVKQNTPSLVFKISKNEKDPKTATLQDRVVSLQNFLEKVPPISCLQGKGTAKDNLCEGREHGFQFGTT